MVEKQSSDTELVEPNWILFRIDDNGNEMEMSRFHDQQEAESVAMEYQAKGHKQAYFVKHK